jgi:hypothetical protein
LSTLLAAPAALQDRQIARNAGRKKRRSQETPVARNAGRKKRKVGRVKQDPAMTIYIYQLGRNAISP